MIRLRDPWFRDHDRDAHHALRQVGVLPWEPPLEGQALVYYEEERRMETWIRLENLALAPDSAERRQRRDEEYKQYLAWVRLTHRMVISK